MLARHSKAESPSFNKGYARNKSRAEYPELYPDYAWSPCLGNTGLVLRDAAGRGQHGTLTNMDPATDWVTSEGRWALDFDGTDDTVDCGAAPYLYSIPQCTLMGWLKRNAAGSLFGFGTVASPSARTEIAYHDSGNVYFVVDGAFTAFATNDTAFHHVALVFVGGVRVTGYLDGRQVTETTSSIPATTNTSSQGNFFIGKHEFGAGPAFGTGRADDVRVYQRALSANEIALDYSLGRGGWAAARRKAVVSAAAAAAGSPAAYRSILRQHMGQVA